MVCTTIEGRYQLSFIPSRQPIGWVGLSVLGYIVVYSARRLYLYTINGRCLHSEEVGKLFAFYVSKNGEYLVSGGDQGHVVVRSIPGLFKEVHRFRGTYTGQAAHGNMIRSIATTPLEKHLFVGLQSGHVLIFAYNRDHHRRVFTERLVRMGF